jgi:hypothetical protein
MARLGEYRGRRPQPATASATSGCQAPGKNNGPTTKCGSTDAQLIWGCRPHSIDKDRAEFKLASVGWSIGKNKLAITSEW